MATTDATGGESRAWLLAGDSGNEGTAVTISWADFGDLTERLRMRTDTDLSSWPAFTSGLAASSDAYWSDDGEGITALAALIFQAYGTGPDLDPAVSPVADEAGLLTWLGRLIHAQRGNAHLAEYLVCAEPGGQLVCAPASAPDPGQWAPLSQPQPSSENAKRSPGHLGRPSGEDELTQTYDEGDEVNGHILREGEWVTIQWAVTDDIYLDLLGRELDPRLLSEDQKDALRIKIYQEVGEKMNESADRRRQGEAQS